MLLAIDLVVALALNTFLKDLFHRPRPQPFFGISPPHTYSFPSGHALFSICFYGMLAALLATRLERQFSRVLVWIFAGLLVLAWVSVLLMFDKKPATNLPGRTGMMIGVTRGCFLRRADLSARSQRAQSGRYGTARRPDCGRQSAYQAHRQGKDNPPNQQNRRHPERKRQVRKSLPIHGAGGQAV